MASYESAGAPARSYTMEGAGWLSFAGIMLVLVGFFNVIDGIAAIGNSDYVVNQLLFAQVEPSPTRPALS